MPEKAKNREHVAIESPNLVDEQAERLRELFPQAFSEGKVDFEKLRAALGDLADERPERYSFTWAGKRDAIRLLQTPSRATLVPCPQQSVNWDTTRHVFIEGENLEVLKLLYKSYAGRVKMIYIDPPYNTGNDFIYPDNFADPLDNYLRVTGQKADNGDLLTSNPETAGRYHSAWLSMMYPRLFLARQLLREDGIILVSIDDHEVHDLRMLMNEVFGHENFVACVVWQHSVQAKGYLGKFSLHHNYLLVYQRSEAFALQALKRREEHNKNYSNRDDDPKGPWRPGDVRNALYRPNLIFDIETPSGKVIRPPKNGWRWSRDTIQRKITSGEIVFSQDESRIIRKIYLADVQGRAPESVWFGKEVGTTREANDELKQLFSGESPYDTPKPTRLVRRMLEISTDGDCDHIVIDFFAGSCTTGHAVLAQNRHDGGSRRFVAVQVPEAIDESTPAGNVAARLGLATVADVGMERVRRAIAKLDTDSQGRLDFEDRAKPEDLGFRVYKLDKSNYRNWTGAEDNDPANLVKQMELFKNPLLPGWEPISVIHELAIKEGYDLSCRVEELPNETVETNVVHRVTDDDRGQSFLICLDDKLDPATPKALDLKKDDLLVCRDVALTDELAANLALQCRLKTI